MPEERLCEIVGSGWVFPVAQGEVDLDESVRVVIYAIALVYTFLGVAIISDVFMSSIDKITSRRRKVRQDSSLMTPKVWNDTVATLSLMALGSSAPEIFLSIVEIFKKQFHIGGLGTSTIVGSASFNLFVIIAACMVSIPAGEGREIKDLAAFYITACFSLLAYLWLWVISELISPKVVESWEAIVTIIFLPLLIWTSYKADTGGLDRLAVALGMNIAGSDESAIGDDAADKRTPSRIEFKPTGATKNELIVQSMASSQILDVFVQYDGQKPAMCKYHTEPLSAVPTFNYEDCEGELDFSEGPCERRIGIDLCAACSQIDRDVLLILEEIEGDAEFDPDGNGGPDTAILVISIKPMTQNATVRRTSAQIVETHAGSVSGFRRVCHEWRDQFYTAVYCGGSAEEQSVASAFDWACHLVALPWKLGFAWSPPLFLLDGWACFIWSLGGIACMTMIVSDFAELFGCCLDIPDICTALIFVALGTSMPDLFASLSAAKDDPTADASIVNVTGSNSVNVFLGVGMPYSIAALYWECSARTSDWEQKYPDVAREYSGGRFVVKTTGLSFSIVCFCYCCVLAFLVLWARRKFLRVELGGPQIPKFLSAGLFFFYWCSFVGTCSWWVLRKEKGVSRSEEIGVLVGTAAAVFTFTILVLISCKAFSGWQETSSESGNGHVSKGETQPPVELQKPESNEPMIPAGQSVLPPSPPPRESTPPLELPASEGKPSSLPTKARTVCLITSNFSPISAPKLADEPSQPELPELQGAPTVCRGNKGCSERNEFPVRGCQECGLC